MPSVESVKVLFTGDATPLMASMTGATKALSRFGTNAFFLGSRITAGIGLPIALLTKSVAGLGMKFDQAMTESLAIMDRNAQTMRVQMENVAKDIARQTKFSSEEAAQAYFFLASSGMNAAESMKALPIAARFAQAGVIDLEKATELLSDAYITLGLRSENNEENMQNMARVADVLTEANNQAQGTITEFAQALTNRAGVAMRTFGIDVETGVAALAAFAERGIKGRTAGRQLFIVFRDLQRAVLKNREEWELLVGPNAVFDIAQRDFKNIGTIIGTLEKSLDGLGDATKKETLQMLGFQERSLQATLALVGASERIQELEGHLRSAGGVTERVAEKQMMSLTNQLSLLTERLRQVGMELFEAFKPTIENHVIPSITWFLSKLESLVSWIKTLSPRTKELIVNFMAFAVALGPIVAGVGALALVMIPIIAVMGKFIAVFTVGTRVLMSMGPAFAFVTGAAKRFQPVNAAGFRPFVATGNKAVFAIKTIGKSLLALLGPLGMVTFAVWIGWEAWKMWKSGTEGSTKAARDLSEEIGLTALRFKELIDEYKHLTAQEELSEEQKNRLAHAEEMMAKAVGISVDQFRAEIAAGGQVLKTIEDLANARLEEGKAAVEAAEARKQVMQEELDLAKRRADAINRSLNVNKMATPFALGATGPIEDSPNFHLPIIPISDKIQADLKKAYSEQLKLIADRSQAIGKLGDEILVLKDKVGILTEEEQGRLNVLQNVFDQEKDNIAQEKIRQIQMAESIKKIEAMTAALKGQADEGLLILREAWQDLTIEEQENEGVVKRLWERYSKLREELDPSAFPADLEKATRALREQEEAMKFANSMVGKFIQSMKGIDPQIDEFLRGQDHVILEFKRLKGVMDPRFFEQHGKLLETLATHYADQLSPELQEMVAQYEEWRVESKKTTDQIVKDQKKSSESLINSSDRMTAKMKDKLAELAAFSLSTQDAELVGLKKGYNLMKLAHEQELADMMANVELMAEEEQHMGMLRIDEFIANGETMLAAEKRIGLLRMLEALDADDRIIRNHEQFGEEWLQIEIDRLRKAMDEWDAYNRRVTAISSAGSLFSEFGLDSISGALSGLASASNDWGESVQKWSGEDVTGFDKLTIAIDMATAAMAAYNAISQIKSRKGRAGAGAMAGAQMGSAFGPIGAVVGAGIGAIAGAIAGDPRWAKIQKSIQSQWQVNITDELSKQIEATAQEVGSDWGAMLLHLNDVINESGGVTAGNVDSIVGRIRDSFSMVEMSILSTAQAAQILNDNFEEVARVGTGVSGVINANVLELMKLDEQFRTNSEAIAEFKSLMVGEAVEGLNQFSDGIDTVMIGMRSGFETALAEAKEAFDKQKEENEDFKGNWDDVSKEMHDAFRTQFTEAMITDFNDLQAFTAMTFLAMVEDGATFAEALNAVGPSLDVLGQGLHDMGLEGNEAIERLLRIRKFQQENEGIIKQVDGMNQLMLGLANSGLITESSFDQFGDTALRQFKKMIDAGLHQNDALLLMAPTLRTLKDMADTYGFELDENTEALIRQAEKAGILGDKAKTADDKMIEGLTRIAEGIEKMVGLLNGDWSTALENAARKAQEESNNIQNSFNNITLPHLQGHAEYQIRYDYPEFRPPTGTEGESYASGGIITRPHLAMVGEGGQPEMIGPVSFMSKALEGALGSTGPNQIERETLNELHGLRSDLKTLPIHLRDAIILSG